MVRTSKNFSLSAAPSILENTDEAVQVLLTLKRNHPASGTSLGEFMIKFSATPSNKYVELMTIFRKYKHDISMSLTFNKQKKHLTRTPLQWRFAFDADQRHLVTSISKAIVTQLFFHSQDPGQIVLERSAPTTSDQIPEVMLKAHEPPMILQNIPDHVYCQKIEAYGTLFFQLMDFGYIGRV